MFKRDTEEETRRSSVQKSASGIFSSLAEINKVMAPQTTDKGGATNTKNFESLLRQPPLTSSNYASSYANKGATTATVRINVYVLYFFLFTNIDVTKHYVTEKFC